MQHHKRTTRAGKRIVRHARIRATVHGTAERPRLSVFRSLTGMKLQLIDDQVSKTVVAVDSKTVDTKGDAGERTGRIAQSYLVGKALAEKALAAGIRSIVFDRGGNKYHGRVRAAAEGARDGGLQF